VRAGFALWNLDAAALGPRLPHLDIYPHGTLNFYHKHLHTLTNLHPRSPLTTHSGGHGCAAMGSLLFLTPSFIHRLWLRARSSVEKGVPARPGPSLSSPPASANLSQPPQRPAPASHVTTITRLGVAKSFSRRTNQIHVDSGPGPEAGPPFLSQLCALSSCVRSRCDTPESGSDGSPQPACSCYRLWDAVCGP
jgi:hypothetical protein